MSDVAHFNVYIYRHSFSDVFYVLFTLCDTWYQHTLLVAFKTAQDSRLYSLMIQLWIHSPKVPRVECSVTLTPNA